MYDDRKVAERCLKEALYCRKLFPSCKIANNQGHYCTERFEIWHFYFPDCIVDSRYII